MTAKDNRFNIVETIRDIKKAREELQSAIIRYRKHAAPIITDMTLIPVIYEWFVELSGNDEETARQVYGLFPDAVRGGAIPAERRRQFIFIILYLYAPNRLFAGKMPKGLRRTIARTLGVQSDTVLSDNANDVLKRYEIYKQWAKDVDKVLAVIIERLKAHDRRERL